MTTTYTDKRKIKVRLPESVEKSIVNHYKDLKGYIDTGDINEFIQKTLFNVLVADRAIGYVLIKKAEIEEPYKDRQVFVPFDLYKELKNAAYENDLPDIQVTLSVLLNQFTFYTK